MTHVLTLWFATLVHYLRGERAAAAHAAGRVIALIDAHGFPVVGPDTVVLLHAARGDRLDVNEVDDLRRRVIAARSTGLRQLVSFGGLAGLYADAGRPADGLAMLASVDAMKHDSFFSPEIRRIEGELLLQTKPGAVDAAEAAFHAAIEDARRRQEIALELRAATSLARLWRACGKHDDARAVLGGVYGRFTEGFGTADLTAAKTLLDELSITG